MSDQSNAGATAAAPVAAPTPEAGAAPAPRAAPGTPNPYLAVARVSTTEFVRGVFAITPDDVNALPFTAHGIYVGGAGNIVMLLQDGSTGTFTAVPAGTQFPFVVVQVKATGTTATGLVGLR